MKQHLGRCFRSLGSRSPGSKRIVWTIVLCMSAIGPLAFKLSAQSDASRAPNAPTAASFAGTWKGVCQDGKAFVLITLHFVANRVEGTLSLGNVNLGSPGANGAGTCTATEPATAEHSLPILRTMIAGNRLILDSRGPELEMILTGESTAQLRFPSESMAASYFEIRRTSQ